MEITTEITTEKSQNIDNRISIKQLPEDILNKILYHTQETIYQKIDKQQSIMKLIEINRYICNHIDNLRVKLSNEIKEGCIYKLSFRSKGIDYTDLYLINTASLNKKNDCINICRVEPDSNNERIFGKYKIVKKSMMLCSCAIYSCELEYKPPPVNYNSSTLLLSEPIRVYGIDNYILSRYPNWNFNTNIKIIYNTDIMSVKNHYCLVQVIRVLKHSVKVRLPNDPAIHTIPKKVLYNTISHNTFGLF
jgi:hypothetical protein